MSVIGYTRVSTSQQTCLNQEYEIRAYCKKHSLRVTKWVTETISSRCKLSERKLGQVMCSLKKGDILITSEISRLGRNMLEIMGILRFCLEKDCQIITIKENYHLGADIQSKVLAFAFSLASEIERELISQRTKESLKRLKHEGHHLGRPYGQTYHKLSKYHEDILLMLQNKMPKNRIAKIYGCSWVTVHRYILKYVKTEQEDMNILKEIDALSSTEEALLLKEEEEILTYFSEKMPEKP